MYMVWPQIQVRGLSGLAWHSQTTHEKSLYPPLLNLRKGVGGWEKLIRRRPAPLQKVGNDLLAQSTEDIGGRKSFQTRWHRLSQCDARSTRRIRTTGRRVIHSDLAGSSDSFQSHDQRSYPGSLALCRLILGFRHPCRSTPARWSAPRSRGRKN